MFVVSFFLLWRYTSIYSKVFPYRFTSWFIFWIDQWATSLLNIQASNPSASHELFSVQLIYVTAFLYDWTAKMNKRLHDMTPIEMQCIAKKNTKPKKIQQTSIPDESASYKNNDVSVIYVHYLKNLYSIK